MGKVTNKNEIELIDNIHLFMQSGLRNVWIFVDGFKLYVRKSKRLHQDQLVDCFDLASMDADVPGTGILTRLLEELLKRYPTTNFFVESILNPRLPAFLEKYGFVEYRQDDMILIR